MVAGLLADRERREREKQERLAGRLSEALEEQRRIESQLIRITSYNVCYTKLLRGGIVREVWSDTVGAQARVIRLDVRLMTEPDGNLVA